ncbi:MAG: hypothetical protein LBJ31_04830 [Treponema sp.]|jgi:hypothetical protein|nr:hypothetical protein [Treponema sp.]
MKKSGIKSKIILGIALAFFTLPLCAQNAPKDLILMVDTSVSMSPYYSEAGTYLTGPFLAENLAFGDTFHLISFAAKPRFEIARQVHDEGDIETVSGRILLLYPIEPNADIPGALSYAERQIRAIPGGRPKKLVIVTDKDAASQIEAVSARFKSAGIDIVFLRVPVRASVAARTPAGPAAGTGRTGSPGTPLRESTQPQTPERQTPERQTPEQQTPEQQTQEETQESRPPDGGARGLPEDGYVPVVITPPPADITAEVKPGAGQDAAGGRNTPGAGWNMSALTAFLSSISIPLPLLAALGLLLILVVILVIVFLVRRLHSSPNRVMANASTDDTAARNAELLNSFASQQAAAKLTPSQRRYQHHRDDSSQFMTNPPMLNLFVEEQNTAIGRRNVHALKKGSTFTVGGGKSDFLIFLVPLPARLGQLRYDGNNCTFTPFKGRYFPDIGSNPVTECIGKTIRVLSDRNYEIFFHFERYKDPLIVLNQLLHSINVPEASKLTG